MYLIDTDIVIDFLKNRPEVVNFFQKLGGELIKISIITFIEVQYGIKKSYQPKENEKRFNDFLKTFSISILPIEASNALKFIDVKLGLEEKKSPLADFDLLIAATAIANNLTLLTRNKRHFLRIKGLKVI